MPLGWIDFSKAERDMIVNVLDNLTEDSTLDELGLLQIRNGFAEIFFPGTSTIQKRAKYFMIVPYACKDLEKQSITNPKDFIKKLDELEKECAEQLKDNSSNEKGIIGNRTLQSKKGDLWLKRKPSDIYWSGLKSYGIFSTSNNESPSKNEYARSVCFMKKKLLESKNSRNRKQLTKQNSGEIEAQEFEFDDIDAGSSNMFHKFWNIPTYKSEWLNKNLSIKLTKEEAEFLKNQIIKNYKDSMLGFLLENCSLAFCSDNVDLRSIIYCDNFGFMDFSTGPIKTFPESIQSDYKLAYDFSNFAYAIRIVYNLIASRDQNQEAVELFKVINSEIDKYTCVDLDAIFRRLMNVHSKLKEFLINSRQFLLDKKTEELKKIIIDREVSLKGKARAKSLHSEEIDPLKWYGGRFLDYRYSNAKVIVKDILEGLVNGDANVKSI